MFSDLWHIYEIAEKYPQQQFYGNTTISSQPYERQSQSDRPSPSSQIAVMIHQDTHWLHQLLMVGVDIVKYGQTIIQNLRPKFQSCFQKQQEDSVVMLAGTAGINEKGV
jgi:hypothetical protein